ncbi:MAG: TetR/AcrR family transcriptional regulator [Nocardioidaceae bacterium]
MASVTPSTDDPQRDDPRPMRADARRNYDKLLVAAREVFAGRGSDASLDEIAKRAGVGPGTLYRHFPTRDALIDALMRDWVEQVRGDSRTLVESGAPALEVLRRWFERFLEHVGVYRGAATKMMSSMDDPSSPIHRKCQVLFEANEVVVDYAAAQGVLREGVDGRDVVRLVSGVAAYVEQAPVDAADAGPMLEIVLRGITEP